MNMTGFFRDRMRPAAVLGCQALVPSRRPGLIDPGFGHIQVVHVRFLLVRVGDRALEQLLDRRRRTLVRELQDVQCILHIPAGDQLVTRRALRADIGA